MTRRAVAVAALVTSSFVALPLQAQTHDVTRYWTECVFQTGSCAALSMRTFGLDNGGSHVSVGLSSLYGQTASYNAGLSILMGASFTFANTPLSASPSSFALSGVGSAGTSGSSQMRVIDEGGDIVLRAVPTRSQSSSTRGIFNDYYYCGPDCHSLGYGSYETDVTTTLTTNVVEGIAPNIGDAWTHSTGENPMYASRGGYTSTYECDWGCGYTYSPFSYSQYVGLADLTSYQFDSDAATPAGTSFSYSFDSDVAYDARNVTGVFFSSVSNATGFDNAVQQCEGFTCTVVSDETVSATPEPATLILVASGLAAVSVLARRRRGNRRGVGRATSRSDARA